MSKRESAKYKIDRRLGENIWGRPKSPVNKREYGPGQHGQRRKKATDFGTQLILDGIERLIVVASSRPQPSLDRAAPHPAGPVSDGGDRLGA